MKYILKLIRFMITGNVFILCAIFVAYTMIAFLYYYYHLHQDPMGYFRWWWGNILSFRIMNYLLYLTGFEIALLIAGILYLRRQQS